jgi:hypothetical protein
MIPGGSSSGNKIGVIASHQVLTYYTCNKDCVKQGIILDINNVSLHVCCYICL